MKKTIFILAWIISYGFIVEAAEEQQRHLDFKPETASSLNSIEKGLDGDVEIVTLKEISYHARPILAADPIEIFSQGGNAFAMSRAEVRAGIICRLIGYQDVVSFKVLETRPEEHPDFRKPYRVVADSNYIMIFEDPERKPKPKYQTLLRNYSESGRFVYPWIFEEICCKKTPRE